MNLLFNPKLLIVGYGTLGRTLAQSLAPHFDLEIKDRKNVSINSIGSSAAGVIICVNNTNEDGSIDTDSLELALDQVRAELGAPHIMVKTTITPDLVDSLLPDNAIYSPEFLRQDNAYADFQNQPFMLLGGDNKNNHFWRKVFSYLNTEFIETTPEAASWTKYLHNCYLASKVSWFHEMDDAAEALGDKHNFYEALGIVNQFDDAIGDSHLYAPNTDGTYGYAGHCFPKDMKAFQKYLDSDLLTKIMEHNDDQRTRSPKQ